MLKPGSFDMCKNITALIIVMLGHSEINTEVSDIGVKTIKFNDCRELLENDRNINSILAIIWKRARSSCKDGQKFVDPFI